MYVSDNEWLWVLDEVLADIKSPARKAARKKAGQKQSRIAEQNSRQYSGEPISMPSTVKPNPRILPYSPGAGDGDGELVFTVGGNDVKSIRVTRLTVPRASFDLDRLHVISEG